MPSTHAVMLPHVIAYNFMSAPDAMRRIARALQASDAITGINALAASLPIPRSLEALSMPESGIEHAVALTLRDAYANPRSPDPRALKAMLERAFRGIPASA